MFLISNKNICNQTIHPFEKPYISNTKNIDIFYKIKYIRFLLSQ